MIGVVNLTQKPEALWIINKIEKHNDLIGKGHADVEGKLKRRKF